MVWCVRLRAAVNFIVIISINILQIASASNDKLVSLSNTDLQAALTFGPWPPSISRDASNRVSGQAQAIALGERLFFNPRLSGGGQLLCASCHAPWRNGTDGRARAFGIAPLERNTPALVNVRLHRWFGWDGANDTLWGQSIRPLLNPREMNSSASKIAAMVRQDPDILGSYKQVFGTSPSTVDEAVLVDLAKALAAYQETLLTGRTLFDEFRDAIARGDIREARRYPVEAQRGLAIFLGKGRCASCHAGPNFSDDGFYSSGVVNRLAGEGMDAGRQEGKRKWQGSPYTRFGSFSDDRRSVSRRAGRDTEDVANSSNAAGRFRTPGLRNVALTAPYLHDGSLATLCEVVRQHAAAAAQRGGVTVQGLSAAERHDTVMFLETLTSDAPKGWQRQGCR